MIFRVALAVGLVSIAAVGTGCATTYSEVNVRPAAKSNGDEPERFFPPPIQLAVAEDAIVRLVGPKTTCSGTLVAEDLVLTAHHCVVNLGAKGEFTKELVAAGDIRVELGGDYLPWGTIDVKEVVAPPCGESGGAGDVAILVLTRKIIGIVPYTVRVEAPPRVGELLDPAGFGRCALSPDGIRRTSREGGTVDVLGGSTLNMTASVCPGDSGGPVISRGSHEIVGVVSLSAMDADARTRSPSIMARVDMYRPLFAEARLIADGASKSELPPLTCGR
ncbi:hypothetical protein BH09MYX1_BH09MYX1_24390 [soil metagenome]